MSLVPSRFLLSNSAKSARDLITGCKNKIGRHWGLQLGKSETVCKRPHVSMGNFFRQEDRATRSAKRTSRTVLQAAGVISPTLLWNQLRSKPRSVGQRVKAPDNRSCSAVIRRDPEKVPEHHRGSGLDHRDGPEARDHTTRPQNQTTKPDHGSHPGTASVSAFAYISSIKAR